MLKINELWAVEYRTKTGRRVLRVFANRDKALEFHAECVDAQPVLYRTDANFQEVA